MQENRDFFLLHGSSNRQGHLSIVPKVAARMARSVESILHDVRELDRDTQIDLADKIIAEVSSADIEREQWEEIRERVAAYKRGEIEAADGRAMLAPRP